MDLRQPEGRDVPCQARSVWTRQRAADDTLIGARIARIAASITRAGPATRPPPTLLIAEDAALIATEFSLIATEVGFVVTHVAYSEKHALEILLAGRIDAAIVDYWLEDGPSDRLIAELEGRSVPTIVVSAAPPDELPLPTALRRIVLKPFPAIRLTTMLRSLLPRA